jgi:hypothetical protein
MSIKYKEVTLSRTFNLGNYENVKPELTVEVSEDEDPQEVLKVLDAELNEFRGSLEN